MAILNNNADVAVFAEGLDHPEGIAWGPDGYAYAGGEAGQLYRIDMVRREATQFAVVAGGFILGLALDAANNIYACDMGEPERPADHPRRRGDHLQQRDSGRAHGDPELPRVRQRGQPVRGGLRDLEERRRPHIQDRAGRRGPQYGTAV